MLAFAAGVSVGFTLGRLFERLEYTRRGYRLSKRGEGNIDGNGS